MITTVSGKHMEVGPSLQEHVKQKIAVGVKDYLSEVTQSRVTFSKSHHLYHVDIQIHDGVIGLIKSASESDDVYAAFDNAFIKIEKQLRKYRGKIKNHPKKSKDELDSLVSGTKYVLNVSTPDDHAKDYSHEPVTIAEKAMNIEKLSVSEAIMKMDLAHLPALIFINKLNSRLNVVYHRVDGNISWVDPEEFGCKC